MIPLPALARLASRPAKQPIARCELCGGPIGDVHRHVVERGVRGVHCACHPCGILFGRGDARYRTVPARVLADPDPVLDWDALGIPVAVAYCYRDSMNDRSIVCYPGPAGIIDADLEPAVWDALRAATPLAAHVEDDVEALLVRGARGTHVLSCYLVPITAAYELAGRLRSAWQGFSGGDAATAMLAEFFADLDRRGVHV